MCAAVTEGPDLVHARPSAAVLGQIYLGVGPTLSPMCRLKCALKMAMAA